MDFWLVVGIFLLGCGLGSLVTAAFYLTQLRKVKNRLQAAYPGSPHSKTPRMRQTEKLKRGPHDFRFASIPAFETDNPSKNIKRCDHKGSST